MEVKLNKRFIYFICMVSAMGGFLFGYDWVVIGGAKSFYESYFGILEEPVLQGWAMSVALLGCLVGAMFGGYLADRYGRKPLLLVSALLFLVSAYYTGAVSTFNPFLIARFVGGIGIGIASNLSPMYIAEISPSKVRGQLISLNQLAIVIGILAAQVVNWLLAEPVVEGVSVIDTWNGQMGWRWMFWAEAVPALLFLLLTFFIPESPRWLAVKGKEEKARFILSKIGNDVFVNGEIEAIQQQDKKEHPREKISLFSRSIRKVLLIGVVLAVFQQWCGTNVIFNYAQDIFQSAGYTMDDVFFNIVVTGIANLLFTFVAIFTVDRWGRRVLMMVGASGLAGIYIVLGTCYFFEVSGWFMVLLVVMAIACYAMSLGPVTWVILAEIFPNKIRGAAMAVATFALWMGCFLLTYTFPILNNMLGSSGTFWIYGLICIGGFLFISRKLPETKGKSLEELENLTIHNSREDK